MQKRHFLFYKLKNKLFPQSYVLDELLSREYLAKDGYPHLPLKNPILYRGDTRAPKIIFLEGFYRRIKNNVFQKPEIEEGRVSSKCIACTKDLVYAVGFADCPVDTQGWLDSKKKSETSWVYVLYSKSGIDLSDGTLYDKEGSMMAGLVNEVTLTGVSPEKIIAAFQIKTTKNCINDYYRPDKSGQPLSQHKSWHILVTDFVINPNCTVQYFHPELYHKTLAEFKDNVKNGHFYIPWSPIKEEKDFAITHGMSDSQKEGYRLGFTRNDVVSKWFSWQHVEATKHGIGIELLRGKTQIAALGLRKNLSFEQVKDLQSEIQIDGLLAGFSRADVMATWFHWRHVDGTKHGLGIELLRGKTEIEVRGLIKNLSFEQVKDLQKDTQIDGLLAGFSREDVMAAWFNWRHVEAKKDGLAIELLRGKTEIEVLGLTKNLSFEQVKDLQRETQIDGLLAGFAREDVMATWFNWRHVEAKKDGLAIELLRGKTEIEVLGLTRNLSFEQVKGLQSEIQIDGLLVGFSREDVIANWFEIDCVFQVRKGISIDKIRETAQTKEKNTQQNNLNSTLFENFTLFKSNNMTNRLTIRNHQELPSLIRRN